MWRRAGEELITHRQAGEQQTDAMRARLSSAQPGRREERRRRGGQDGGRERWRKREAQEERRSGRREGEGREGGEERERVVESGRGGYCNRGRCNEICEREVGRREMTPSPREESGCFSFDALSVL